MRVPLSLLIEQERKKREAEREAERPVLRIPAPDYDYYEVAEEPPEATEPQRGVIVIDLVGEEEE